MFREMDKLLKITGKGGLFIILLILRSPFDAVNTIVNALFLKYSFIYIDANDNAALFRTCMIFTFACLCLFLYNGIIRCFYAPFVVRMESKLRRKLFNKISMFSLEKIENTSNGDWLTRLNTDVQMPFSRPIHLPHAVCAILNIIVSMIILGSMNPAVLCLVLLFVIPHIVVSYILVARVMPQLNKNSLEAAAVNTNDFSAIINCAETTVLYDGRDYLMERFNKSSMRLLKAKMKINKRNALNAGILPLFSLSGFIILLIFTGIWIAEGNFTFGDFTAASQYRGGILLGSMMLINSIASIRGSLAGIKRINETMSEDIHV